jgi:glycerophosphoryl diester phosphodiesterase
MKTSFHRPEPVVIAHRGSRLLWPENTMTAFAGAADSGVRLIETDLRVSADGVLHCFHDAFLERTTNGRGPIGSRSSADLVGLDAGHWHKSGDGYPFRGRGIGIPTFTSVLEAFPDFGFVIDVKNDGVVDPLATLIKERNLEERLIVGSFSTERLLRLQETCGKDVATSTGPAETVRAMLAGRLRNAFLPFGSTTVALQVPVVWYGVPVVSAGLVSIAHDFGKLVHVWTINELDEMKRLLDLGVDGIITDRPDLAVSLI